MRDHLPFVDIHCHLTPGIDDGAQSWDDTLRMARMAMNDGFSTIIVTPHQLGKYRCNQGDLIRKKTDELSSFLRENDLSLEVLPGGDVRIESDLVALIRHGEVLTLADRGRHVLLELPHELYMPLEPLLQQLTAVGIVGVLSHPERNAGILGCPRVVGQLVNAGCLMQVTAGSLTGAFGPQIQEFSEWLVQNGLVHFLATDAHGWKNRRPRMQAAFDRVTELTDQETALDLCCRNPLCVTQGEDVTSGRRKVATKRFWSRLLRRKAG